MYDFKTVDDQTTDELLKVKSIFYRLVLFYYLLKNIVCIVNIFFFFLRNWFYRKTFFPRTRVRLPEGYTTLLYLRTLAHYKVYKRTRHFTGVVIAPRVRSTHTSWRGWKDVAIGRGAVFCGHLRIWLMTAADRCVSIMILGPGGRTTQARRRRSKPNLYVYTAYIYRVTRTCNQFFLLSAGTRHFFFFCLSARTDNDFLFVFYYY